MCSKHNIGDLVWAKKKGFSPWPARICQPRHELDTPKEVSKFICVYFFETDDYAWVKSSNVKPYKMFKDSMMRYCNTAAFKAAVNQIEECIDNPKKYAFIDILSQEIKKEVDADNSMNCHEEELSEKSSPVLEEAASPSLKLTTTPMARMLTARVVLDRVKVRQCETCALCFLTDDEYMLHKVTHVTPTVRKPTTNYNTSKEYEKNYKCEECDAMFVLKSTLEEHSILHDPFPYICDCGLGFYREMDFMTHVKLLHPDRTVPKPKISEKKEKIEDVKPKKVTYKKLHTKKNIHKGSKLIKRAQVPKIPKVEYIEVEEKILQTGDNNYACGECDQLFADYASAEDHAATHKNIDWYECKQCHKTFKNVIEFEIHIKTHTIQNDLTCHICNETFTNTENMKSHYETHPGKQPYFCDKCDQNFSQRFKLEQHLKTHAGISDNVCSHCDKSFSSKRNLRAHYRIHTGVKPFQCNFCDKKFTHNDYLKAHLKKHTGNKDYVCSICNKSFAWKNNLEIHSRVHTGEKPYKCNLCGNSFTQNSALKLHLKRHTGVRDFQCSHCDKAFFDKGARDLHERTHTGIKPFDCSFCGKTFSDPSAIKRHIRTHTGDKPYKCEKCPSRFSDASALIQHRKRHGAREVPCDLCDKMFVGSSDLAVHFTAVHVRRRKFECDYCGKKFVLKSHLVVHIKGTHMRDDRFECDYCLKIFPMKHALSRHIYVSHTKKLQFECDYCGEKFYCKTYIAKHIHTCHGVALYCHVCRGMFYSESDLLKHKAKGCAEKEYRCDICNKKVSCAKSLRGHMKSMHFLTQPCQCDDCGAYFKTKFAVLAHWRRVHGKY